MKLEPRTKPVRFCIESDGVEHYSLESLREHFDVKAVYELMDGRFVRWLNLIGEGDIAARILESGNSFEDVNNTDEASDMFSDSSLLKLLNLIYQNEWVTLYDAYIGISNGWKYLEYPHLDTHLKALDIPQLLEDYKICTESKLAALLLQELVKKLDGDADADAQYMDEIGRGLVENSIVGSEGYKKGVEYVKRALSKGYADAALWLIPYYAKFDIDALLQEYKNCKNNKETDITILLRKELAKRLDGDLGDDAEDGQFMYSIGIVLVDAEKGSDEYKKGLNFIKRAKALGSKSANNWISKHRDDDSSLQGFTKPYKLDYATKKYISRCLRGETNFNITNSLSAEEKMICKFYEACKAALEKIRCHRSDVKVGKQEASKLFSRYFSGIKLSDFLGEEIIFLSAMLTGQEFSYNKIIEYGPAKSAWTNVPCILRNSKLNFRNMGPAATIQAILNNFFELSAYGREDN